MSKFSVFFLMSLLFSAASYAQQTQLLSIDYRETPASELLVDFKLSDITEYKAFVLPEPSRLVVDFSETVLIENIVQPLKSAFYLDSIRTGSGGGQKDKQNLRIVLDLKPGIRPANIIVKNNHSNTLHVILKLLPTSTIDKEKRLVSGVHTQTSSEFDDASVDSDERGSQFFSEWQLSGKLGFEELGFFHNGLDSKQHNNYLSGSIEPELYREWDGGKQSFTFSPFFRYSQHDNKRTHFDIRELTWLLAERDWELRVGFRKVFWGVAEGLHLVDIINQTDLVENTDTEDKLGQPMINLAVIRDWGTLDLFILPGFRERTFSGVEGRLRSFPEVSVGDAEYENHGVEKHMAYAIRWSQVMGDWDIGFSHFYGSSREPTFKLKALPTGSLQIIPYYELINQTGLDLQLTHEDWIYKYEGIVREGQGHTFYAMTTGIEYTLFDLFSSGLDLGVVVEYMYDTRSSKNTLAPFQDDILTALRFGFNDVQSTEILAGVMFDRTNNSKFYNIEASRRIADSFKVDLEIRLFSGAPTTDASYSIREDDHIRLEIGYYF